VSVGGAPGRYVLSARGRATCAILLPLDERERHDTVFRQQRGRELLHLGISAIDCHGPHVLPVWPFEWGLTAIAQKLPIDFLPPETV